jgi:hypothetical protein
MYILANAGIPSSIGKLAWLLWQGFRRAGHRPSGTKSDERSSSTARASTVKGLKAFKSTFHPHWQPRYMAAGGGINPVLALMDATFLVGGVKGIVKK